MNQEITAVPAISELSFRERINQVLAISVPIILALTSQNLLNIVDTWIVGRLGSLQLACVALGGTINWVLCSFFIGMGGGVILLAIMATILDPGLVVPLHGVVQLVLHRGVVHLLRRLER